MSRATDKSPVPDAAEIRQRMDRVRQKLDHDVDELVESSRTLADWRQYAKAQPLVAAGIAALAGYLLVPTRPVYTEVSQSSLNRAARKGRLVVASDAKVKPHDSGPGPIATLVTGALLRMGAVWVSQHLGHIMGKAAAENDQAQASYENPVRAHGSAV